MEGVVILLTLNWDLLPDQHRDKLQQRGLTWSVGVMLLLAVAVAVVIMVKW